MTGDNVLLNGSKSTDPDGDPLAYLWRQTSPGVQVALSDSVSVAPTFTAPSTEANLAFSLTVNDGRGGTSSAQTLVFVSGSPGNQPPSANAGADQTVATGAAAMLNGSGSDPFGGPVTLGWVQVSGTGVTLSSDMVPKPGFTAPGGPGLLLFELTVTDEDGRTSRDTTQVTVEILPVPPTPTLYVVSSNGTVSGWTEPHNRDGNEAPQSHLSGAGTRLDLANDVVVDAGRAILVSTRTGQINSWNEGLLAPDAPPNRLVSGELSLLATPTAMALDRARDILFVPDLRAGGVGGVIVFDGVSRSRFDGEAAYARAFWTQSLPDMNVTGATYDTARDLLYLVEASLGGVLVYEDASAANGNTAVSRLLGAQSSEIVLTDVHIDSAGDRLYGSAYSTGASSEGLILIWDNASSVHGTTPPDRQIRVGTHLTSIVVDSTNRGYAAERSNAIYSFDGIDSLNGEVGPSRTIEGSATLLSEPSALALVE